MYNIRIKSEMCKKGLLSCIYLWLIVWAFVTLILCGSDITFMHIWYLYWCFFYIYKYHISLVYHLYCKFILCDFKIYLFSFLGPKRALIAYQTLHSLFSMILFGRNIVISIKFEIYLFSSIIFLSLLLYEVKDSLSVIL